MKPLPETFQRNGFTYFQVVRHGNKAIYEQNKAGAKHYEVGLIRGNKAREVFGKQFEASESWPTSEEWGQRGWTFQTLKLAYKKFYELC